MNDSAAQDAPKAAKPSIVIALLIGMACAVLGWCLCMQAIGLVPIGSSKGLWWSVLGAVLLSPGLVYLAWGLSRRKSRLGFMLLGWLISLALPPAAFIGLAMLLLPAAPHG